MANPIQTLDDYVPGIQMGSPPELLNPISRVGDSSGAHAQFNAWDRPRYRFPLDIPALTESEFDTLFGFLHYHKGDRPFWFLGAGFGDIQNPVLVEYGDGSRTEFFLPNANLIPATTQAQVNGSLVTIDLVAEETGMIRLASAPADQAEVTATYQCKFLCVIELQGDELANLVLQMAKGQTDTPTADTDHSWQVRFVIREIGNAP